MTLSRSSAEPTERAERQCSGAEDDDGADSSQDYAGDRLGIYQLRSPRIEQGQST